MTDAMEHDLPVRTGVRRDPDLASRLDLDAVLPAQAGPPIEAGPPVEAGEPAEGGHVARSALLLGSGATFLAFLDATVVNVAFPNLATSFPGVSVAQLSWVVTAFAVVFAALLAASGRLADALGRRKLFVLSVSAFAITSLAAALAPTIELLIAARALQGGAAAGMIPAALGMVLMHTTPARRTAAIGVWGAVGGLAAAIGPGLGGLVVDVWDWRGVFLINVPFGLLIIRATLRRIEPDLPPPNRPLPSPLDILALILAVGGPVVALSQGGDWGWTDARTLALFAFGIIFGAVVIRGSRVHPAPAVDFTLWRSRPIFASNITSALFGAGMYSWLLASPVFLSVIWHYSVLKSGLGVTPGAFTAAIGAVIVGRRMPVHRHWIAVLVGAALVGGSCLMMGLTLGPEPAYLTHWLPWGLLGGLGIGCVVTGISSIATNALPAEQFAAGTGMLMTSRQFGGAIGVAGLAAILQAHGLLSPDGFYVGFSWCGIVILLAAASAVGLRAGTSRAAGGNRHQN